jgi:hypothetical protein
MRPIAAIGLTCVAAVTAASLSAVSVNSAGSDGLSDNSLIKGADFSRAFSGEADTRRASDDPDEPIRTSRFDQTSISTVELAGAAPLVVPASQSAANPPVVEPRATSAAIAEAPAVLASASEATAVPLERVAPPLPRRFSSGGRMAAMTGVGLNQPGFQPGLTPRSPFSIGRRVSLSLTTNEGPLSPESGLSLNARTERQNLAAQPIAAKSRVFDNRRLAIQVDVSPEKSRKGRWFLFAASSGEALGFNLFGDSTKSSRKRNGWSLEKLAEYGKAQLGLGWRKGPMQVSAVATQREVGAYGHVRDDTVLGVSFTISGGNRLPAPKARRGMPRD